MSSVVVLPAPLRPRTPKNAPRGTSKLRPRRAFAREYDFTKSRTANAGSLIRRPSRLEELVGQLLEQLAREVGVDVQTRRHGQRVAQLDPVLRLAPLARQHDLPVRHEAPQRAAGLQHAKLIEVACRLGAGAHYASWEAVRV